MEIISREILRLDRVVKTFLDFTRPVELNWQTVPLHEFVDEIVELARPQADAPDPGQRGAAAGRRGSPDRPGPAEAGGAEHGGERDGGHAGRRRAALESGREDTAEIRISDSGPGIPPELRDKIFRLYFTTKKEGSGIGLAMTFRIVQLHDGTIDFTSEPVRARHSTSACRSRS